MSRPSSGMTGHPEPFRRELLVGLIPFDTPEMVRQEWHGDRRKVGTKADQRPIQTVPRFAVCHARILEGPAGGQWGGQLGGPRKKKEEKRKRTGLECHSDGTRFGNRVLSFFSSGQE